MWNVPTPCRKQTTVRRMLTQVYRCSCAQLQKLQGQLGLIKGFGIYFISEGLTAPQEFYMNVVS
jgi:hypothetical protein